MTDYKDFENKMKKTCDALTTQLATLPDNLWKLFCLVPVLGLVIAMPIFLKYKLNDKDVAIMAKCNSGVITREEAEAALSRKY